MNNYMREEEMEQYLESLGFDIGGDGPVDSTLVCDHAQRLGYRVAMDDDTFKLKFYFEG